MEGSNTVLFGRESSRGSSAHGMAYAVEQRKTAQHQQECFGDGQYDVDGPNPLGGHVNARGNLVELRAGSFGSKELDAPYTEDGQYGNGKDDNPHPANPLRHTSPEKQSMRERLNVIQNAGSGGGEARHSLEKSVGEIGNVTAYIIR